MNDNGRLTLPNQVGIKYQFQIGPNADPVTVQMAQPGNVQVMVMGGETKLERHAAMILAALSVDIPTGVDLDVLVDKAIGVAERLQVALQRRAEEQQAR